MRDLTGLTLVIVSFGLLAGCRAPDTSSGASCAGAWSTDSRGGLHCATDQVGSPTFGIANLFGTCPAFPLDAGSSSMQATARTASNTIGGGPTCDDFGCGTNSPTVGDGVVFDELDSTGSVPDQHGVKILSARRHGIPVQLSVNRDQLSVTELRGDRLTYTGYNVKDTIIIITSQVGDRVLEHELWIADVDENSLKFWAGEQDTVPAYKILTRPFGDNCPFRVPICKLRPARPGSSIEPVWPEWIEHYAIVFADDRYDTVRKTVSDSSGSTWFNLACAGAAPAKMLLMRHANAASKSNNGTSYSTTTDQRTAMLKMLTADYCGTGTPLTMDGQPLSYGDASHWYPYTPSIVSGDALPPPLRSIEALWTAQGAVCLDEPRLATREDTRDQIGALIDQACGGRRPPPCNGAAGVLNWERGMWMGTPGVHVISANPVPPLGAGAP